MPYFWTQSKVISSYLLRICAWEARLQVKEGTIEDQNDKDWGYRTPQAVNGDRRKGKRCSIFTLQTANTRNNCFM